jgi:hypothetical protein
MSPWHLPTLAGASSVFAKWDAATGQLVGIARGSKSVVPIKASGAITAFAEVEVTSAGQVAPKASGVAIGYAITAASSGDDAQISLY